MVISAHAGLHVLGMQDESHASDWGGNNEYNVDKSYEMVELINQYADKMTIVFLFGHDHSKSESEFALVPGDTITSTKAYADKAFGTQTIDFYYSHAGYITNTIGGQERFAYVEWNKEDGLSLHGGTVEAVSNAPLKGDVTVTTNAVSAKPNTNTNTSSKANAPKTGDDANIVLWASLLLVCGGAAATVVVSTRKKEN